MAKRMLNSFRRTKSAKGVNELPQNHNPSRRVSALDILLGHVCGVCVGYPVCVLGGGGGGGGYVIQE